MSPGGTPSNLVSSISTISLNLGPCTESKFINCAMCARGMCSTELWLRLSGVNKNGYDIDTLIRNCVLRRIAVEPSSTIRGSKEDGDAQIDTHFQP